MKRLLTLIAILFVCAASVYAQGPGVGPQPVAVQFVTSAPSTCVLNRLYIVRSSGVAYMNILGSCTKVFNTAVSLPASASQGDLLYGSAANTYSNLAKDANATRYLSNTGASNNPAWAQVALGTGVSGTLPAANGGTGLSSLGTANQQLRVNGGATALEFFTPSTVFYQTVQDEAGALTQRATINFTGAGVTCVDNAGNTRTDCTVAGGITNSAGANVVPKSNGTNLVASRIRDDGSTFAVSDGAAHDVFTLGATGSFDIGDISGQDTGAHFSFDEGVPQFDFFGAPVVIDSGNLQSTNITTANLVLNKIITPAGTTGAQTINNAAGSVNFAAAATSLIVTNSQVSATSVITCTVGTNDATLRSVQCVAGAGTFTMFGNAAAAAETRVNFLIIY